MQSRMDAQRSFAGVPSTAALGQISQPYSAGMTSSMTSQQVRARVVSIDIH